jgi:hypothetical protein
MYAPGESPAFDKLREDVEGLGISYAMTAEKFLNSRADYDAVTNTLRISRESYENYRINVERAELRRDIVHELSHARQYKTLLDGARGAQARRQRLVQQARSMSEEEFVRFRWSNELEAERTAWEVHNQAVASFEKGRSTTGFSPAFLKRIADKRLEDFSDNKAAYEREFRTDYRSMVLESRPSRSP